MKGSQITKILKTKKKTIKKLNNLRIEYLIALYKNKYANLTGDNFDMLVVANEIQKLIKNERDDTKMFLLLDNFYHKFSKTIQYIANEQEHILKQRYFNEMINNARNEHKVFYLCSYHNSNDDHKDLEGKLYIDEHFDLYNRDTYELIKDKDYNTIQNVTQSLYFRPNCSHYFVAISNEEYKKYDIDELLIKYDMIDNDTPRKTNYKLKNIKLKLHFYKCMYAIKKNIVILNKIAKYRKYLHDNKNVLK